MATRKDVQIDLTETLVLTISTRKSGAAIKTYASVGRRDGGFISHTLFSDYNQLVKETTSFRVTQKQIDAQACSIDIEEVKEAALAYYYEKPEHQNLN